ncbi:uroporphyrinogen-III synthase [Micromonospora craterilacus]|uniref:uroporphyrinogen-III synthase n=1 Tax=Micromonospora craterilacus TaxID=1655439 RepID=UPI0013140261|nr:uroporphyrinogen-III synthase [Micromonospora craterilacus]
MQELAGCTIAVVSERRRHDLTDLLEATAARPVNIQAVRSVAQPIAEHVAAATRRCIERPVHEVIVSSGFGLRAWLRIAEQNGHLDALVARLSHARLLARDAHAADTLRDLGLSQIWATASASVEDLFRYLSAQPMTGRRVVAQVESERHREYCEALRRHGAVVVEVATSRFLPPLRTDVLRRLGTLVIRRQVDALALTGPSSSENLLRQATADGVLDEVLNTLATDVTPVCLGHLAAEPLRAHGLTPYVARAPALTDLVNALSAYLPRRTIELTVAGHRLGVRSQAVVIDHRAIPVQPGPIAVLRALARRPGRVLSPAEIRNDSPTWSDVDDHAVEMAVSRLRRAFDGTPLQGVDLVQTVMKRGYRIASARVAATRSEASTADRTTPLP